MRTPCLVQHNNSGSWKTLMRFDMSGDQADEVLFSASRLFSLDEGTRSPGLRVVKDDGGQSVLFRWSKEKGWVPA